MPNMVNSYKYFPRVYDTATDESLDFLYFAQPYLDEAPGMILDAGCGTGKITIPLARAKEEVQGMDASRHMLKVAQEKAKREGLSIPFWEGRIEELGKETFDWILSEECLQHFLTEQALGIALKGMYRGLRKGGKAVFEMRSRTYFERQLDQPPYGGKEGAHYFIWEDTMEGDEFVIELSVFRPGKGGNYTRIRETYRQRMYPLRTITAQTRKAGFRIVQVTGDWGEAATEQDETWYFVAEK